MVEKAAVPSTQAEDVKPATAARIPQRARGKARFETILDAAAELIVESGVSGVTMHKVAKRAATPTGSMYHFFPDREALVLALRDRHDAALEEIHATTLQITTAQWRAFSTAEVINALVSPVIDYFERNPDCLVIFVECPKDDKDHEEGIRNLRAVIDARVPDAKPAERQVYAEMINALAVGSLKIRLGAAKGNLQKASVYLREIKRALTAYLHAIESNYAIGTMR